MFYVIIIYKLFIICIINIVIALYVNIIDQNFIYNNISWD